MIPPGHVCVGGCQAHTPISLQPPSEVAEHVADHGANGPEVVLAAGVAPSRRWAQQWYGLVVGVAMEDTRFVAARLAIYSTSVLYLRSLRRPSLRPNPKGCAVCDRGRGHPHVRPEPRINLFKLLLLERGFAVRSLFRAANPN